MFYWSGERFGEGTQADNRRNNNIHKGKKSTKVNKIQRLVGFFLNFQQTVLFHQSWLESWTRGWQKRSRSFCLCQSLSRWFFQKCTCSICRISKFTSKHKPGEHLWGGEQEWFGAKGGRGCRGIHWAEVKMCYCLSLAWGKGLNSRISRKQATIPNVPIFWEYSRISSIPPNISIPSCPNLKLTGLMTIGDLGNSEAASTTVSGCMDKNMCHHLKIFPGNNNICQPPL